MAHTMHRFVSGTRKSRIPAVSQQPRQQAGMTLVELMVALFLGLLIIGMALSTILISRNLAATTSDVSALQQQAAYAFRVLGQQIRQAGSPELDLGLTNVPLDRVAFLIDYDNISEIIAGTTNPEDDGYLTVGYRNYEETVIDPTDPDETISDNLFRDCLSEATSGNLITSSFSLEPADNSDGTGRLVCEGVGATTQEIIRNVSDFQVRYLQQANAATQQPTIQLIDAPHADDTVGWSRIVGVEVCLDMVGDERIDVPDEQTYKDCANNDASYANRTHMVFRNIFQLRSQGLVLDRG